MKRLIYIVAGSLSALAVVAMVVTAAIWPILGEVETGNTPEYPDIQPHYYSADPDELYDEAIAAVDELDRWQRVDQHSSDHRVEATRNLWVPGVTDELTIRVEPVTEFVTRVHVHSRSGFEYADFGQNARNIREFLDEMDSRLGAVRFDPRQQDEAHDQPDDADEPEQANRRLDTAAGQQ